VSRSISITLGAEGSWSGREAEALAAAWPESYQHGETRTVLSASIFVGF
jgi:hypothetical protein